MIHTVKGFGIVNKAEIDVFWNSLTFAMIQRMMGKKKVILKKGNAKVCSNYLAVALISHASKVMLKILQAMLQQYMNRELPDVQAGFRKGRGTRDQIANICWIIEKAREFQKNIYFCFIDYRSQQTVESSSRDGNPRPPDLPP